MGMTEFNRALKEAQAIILEKVWREDANAVLQVLRNLDSVRQQFENELRDALRQGRFLSPQVVEREWVLLTFLHSALDDVGNSLFIDAYDAADAEEARSLLEALSACLEGRRKKWRSLRYIPWVPEAL